MTVQSFTCPGTVRFDPGASELIPGLVAESRFFVFTGSDPGRHSGILDAAGSEAERAGTFSVSGEPEVSAATEAAERLRESEAELVLAIGGGSVIDAAKAAAALATNPGPATDYLEVVGKGLPLASDPLPVIAVPTTFGTGSEVTRNAVLGSREHGRKVSMRDPRMVPGHAVIDPVLAAGVPEDVAASSGIDALVHVCEAFVSREPCLIMDGLCLEAMQAGFLVLPGAKKVTELDVSRYLMAKVSLCGGLMIANSKLGAVHGFAGVIGGMTGAPHGKICAALFAHVFRANVIALEGLGEDGLERYDLVAGCMPEGGDLPDLIELIDAMVEKRSLPGLGELGVDPADHGKIIEAAKESSSMRGNPADLGDKALAEILERAA